MPPKLPTVKDQEQVPRGGDAIAAPRVPAVPARKPAGFVAAPSENAGNDEPTLPPASEAANSRKRQVIDIARAVANCAALPVLEITKRRMYRDWLNGRDLAVLQIMYRDPVLGIPPRRAIEHTVREMARLDRKRVA